jgi:hypothetical protein
MNIDQALIALCRKHDLAALSVNVLAADHRPDGFFFSVNAQWLTAGERYCASSNEGTVSEAIAHAIQQVNEARAAQVEVPVMELETAE